MVLVKSKKQGCCSCGNNKFSADEIKAWECELVTNEKGDSELHCLKCIESATMNIVCSVCGKMEIDPKDVEIYYD